MEIAICALPGATSVVLPSTAVGHPPRPAASGESEVVIGPEQSCSDVSVCEMDMRWPGGCARHEITCAKAVLWAVTEQVGGQYEHHTDPSEPLRSARQGARLMSLVPPGMELWGYAHSIRFVRSLRLTFDLEGGGTHLGGSVSRACIRGATFDVRQRAGLADCIVARG